MNAPILESHLVPNGLDGSIFEILGTKWRVFSGLSLSLLILALTAFHFVTHWTRKARLTNKFPGPTIFPFLGNYTVLMGSSKDWQKRLSKSVEKYGSCFRLWLSYKPHICIANGEIAEKVLSGYDNIEKGDQYSAFHKSLGQGLATSVGSKWKRDRKLLNPAFGYQYFEGFMKIFNEQSETMIDILKDEFPDNTRDKNILPFIARCGMDSVYQTAMGVDKQIQKYPEMAFAERTYGLVHCTREKIVKPWLDFPVIWHLFGLGFKEDEHIGNILKDFRDTIDRKMKEKITSNQVSGTHTKPFLAFLMDAIQDKTDLSYHMTTLGATGSETTSSTLNYLLFLLALNPKCQAKVHEEIESVFGNDTDTDVTMSDLPELKYMEMCIKEALRLYPPVAGWFRKLVKDVPLDDGKIIASGTHVLILPWDIHRNPKVFPDPEKFDPYRFLPENKVKIGSWWLPFSLGPRNCIGQRYGMMQMKVILTHLLRKFVVSTEQKRENLEVIYGVVLEPFPEIRLTLTPKQAVKQNENCQ